MANEENLKPFDSNQNREEAKKNGRKGGIASGEARRRKRSMREALEAFIETPLPDDLKAKFSKTGMDTENADYQAAVMAAQVLQAIKGNTRAAVWLSEILGERVQNIRVSEQIDASRKELEAYLDGEKTEGD